VSTTTTPAELTLFLSPLPYLAIAPILIVSVPKYYYSCPISYWLYFYLYSKSFETLPTSSRISRLTLSAQIRGNQNLAENKKNFFCSTFQIYRFSMA